MTRYTRDLLRDVEGYVPGEQPHDPDVIKLNTNENPYPPSQAAIDALHSLSAEAMRKYPDPVALELRTLAAERYGLPGPEWVFAGNGMDEVLALTVRTFVDPGQSILTTDPTYTLYETLAQLHGAHVLSTPLDNNWQLPASFFDIPARLVFLPRPNAPSGVMCRRSDLERLCQCFNGIVYIDEAYVDFADENAMDLPLKYDNVIVGRTFSKSFSMAGMRIGLCAAQPEIIREFMKTKDSYNLNAASQVAAVAALQDYDTMLANVGKVKATRARLIRALQTMDFIIPPSQANFVLAIRTASPGARELFEMLKEKRIFVRYFSTPRLENALRISIGTDQETDILLDALRQAGA